MPADTPPLRRRLRGAARQVRAGLRDLTGGARDGPGAHPERLVAAILALGAGGVVLWLATDLFPYHSANHDEGVYLQQAAMLLEGRLTLRPDPAVRDAVRPWFFVAGDRGLYPKYAPVPAAVFALGRLAGGYRLALGAVAAANAALTYALAAAAFDRRRGVLAAAATALSPLFLFTSAVFLPYAPTAALNLAFAVAYVRSVRRDSLPAAGAAGVAVGLAFFSRPYTAVLFAAPFVCHAAWRVGGAVRRLRGNDAAGLAGSAGPAGPAGVLARQGLTATLGIAFVGLTLAYNAALTGSPFLFPYEAFAPLDGLGFGRREILGHEVEYTPALALRANATVLWTLATDWFVAGPLGTALAALGAGAVLAGRRRTRGGDDRTADGDGDGGDGRAGDGDGHDDAGGGGRDGDGDGHVGDGDGDGEVADDGPLGPRTLRTLLLGVGVSVVAGNVAFWGNYNLLGNPAVAGDGLLGLFGPFYHFDLLVVLSAFAAHGAVVAATGARSRLRPVLTRAGLSDPRARRAAALAVLVLAVPTLGVAEAGALGPPVDRNAAYTDRFERAYAPFEATDTAGGLVFLPPTYGDWRNHPFQWLRNDPGFDGPTVYVTDRGPAGDFATLEAFPNRTYYRYRHHGEWTAAPTGRVVGVLERLRVREAPALRARTVVTVPDRVGAATVSLSVGDRTRRYRYRGDPPDALAVRWTVAPDGASVRSPNGTLRARGDGATLSLDEPTEVSLSVTLSTPAGGTLTYRETLTVRPVAAGTGGDGGDRSDGDDGDGGNADGGGGGDADGTRHVQAVWPPETTVCVPLPDCGAEGVYVPDRPETRPEGIATRTTLLAPAGGNASAAPAGGTAGLGRRDRTAGPAAAGPGRPGADLRRVRRPDR